MSTFREVNNETVAGVNSRFAEVTENDILRMQDTAIPNNTKKATKLGMNVFRGKRYFWQTICSHVQCLLSSQPFSILIAKLRWCLSPWTTIVFHGSISKSHLSQLNFHWAKRQETSPLKKIWMSLSLKMIVISNSKHMTSTWHDLDETSQIVLSILSKLQLPSRNYFKALITWTTILSGQL